MNGHAQDLILLLGRIDERSALTLEQLDRIDHRLQVGDARMTQIDMRISQNGMRIARLEEATRVADQSPPILETTLKRWAPLWLPLAALAATGDLRVALEVAQSALGMR